MLHFFYLLKLVGTSGTPWDPVSLRDERAGQVSPCWNMRPCGGDIDGWVGVRAIPYSQGFEPREERITIASVRDRFRTEPMIGQISGNVSRSIKDGFEAREDEVQNLIEPIEGRGGIHDPVHD